MQRFINSASFPFPLLCHNFEALTLNFCRDGGRPSSSEEIGSLREQEVQVHAAFTRNDFEFPASFCDPGRKSPLGKWMEFVIRVKSTNTHARPLALDRAVEWPLLLALVRPPLCGLESRRSGRRDWHLAQPLASSLSVTVDRTRPRGILDWGFMWILT